MKMIPNYDGEDRNSDLWKLEFEAENEEEYNELRQISDAFELFNGKLRICSLKTPCPYEVKE